MHMPKWVIAIIIIILVLVYSRHSSEAARWLLYTGGLLIEVYVAHPLGLSVLTALCKVTLMQGDRPSQVTVNTGSTVYYGSRIVL